MSKRMLIDALHPEETRVVIADENQIFDFDFITTAKKQLKGNIYLAKITRVEPSLQAAFVEYGGGKQGFLPFSEIHADYYQIPVSDRKRLMEETVSDEDDAETPQDAPAGAEHPDESAHENAQAGMDPSDGQQDSGHSLPGSEPGGEYSESERPAYLSQEAVDVSASEYVESEESDNAPISQPHGDTGDAASPEGEATAKADEAQGGESGSEGVETLPSEEEELQARPKKNQFFKRYKIQEVIRRGQVVLVQVIKEERGNKGVSLTTYLSLAGRYCVLMPNSPKDGGISRKIASADDRKRLKAISTEMRLAQGMSVIIRTAGMNRTRAEIKRDFDYLVKLWNQIRQDTLVSNAPSLIYEESDIIKRAIRDQYTSDIDELIIEGDDGYNTARDFMRLLLPSHTPKIKHYNEATPLFYAYNIEEQLLSMHDPVVKLRSGGYIVINPTEALISVDVNSGRATGERNIEETALRTNMEAAAEVARQLRLRDLAGLIVIDFIDMMESRNRRAIEKAIKDALKADRAKIQLGRISPFGLLEMSRQRLRPSISESNMVQCEHCIGRGFIRSNESMSIQMIRAIEKEASAGVWSSLRLIAPQEVALHLLNTKRDILRAIEQRHNLSIQVLIGAELTSSEFNLEKMRRPQSERHDNERRTRERERERSRNERQRQIEASIADEPVNDNAEQLEEMEPTDGEETSPTNDNSPRRRSRRRRGGRNRDRNDRERGDREERGDRGDRGDRSDRSDRGDRDNRGNRAPRGRADNRPESDLPAQDNVVSLHDTQENAPGEEPQQEGPGRRNRGGRGRRRWRDRDGNERSRDNRPPRQGGYETAEQTDGNTLPAFATEERLPEPPAPSAPEPVVASPVLEPSSRNPDAPSKKGWWQKMIELDD